METKENIRCPSCNKEYKIPQTLKTLRITCQVCGLVFYNKTVNENNTKSCLLCNNFARGDLIITLSSGEIIHQACLDLQVDKIQKTVNKINNLHSKLNEAKYKLKKSTSLKSRILVGVLKNKDYSKEIKTSIRSINKEIENSQILLDNFERKLTNIYDYWLDYPPDWDDRRTKVKKRDGESCSRCFSTSKELHVHHKVPLSRGGTNKIENLVLLCKDCHSEEHGRDLSLEFRNNGTAFSRRVNDIRKAIEQGKRVVFLYKKPDETSYTKRTISPEDLVEIDHTHDNNKTLCVYGFCELRQANRNFAIKRMKGLKIIE